MGVDVRGFVFIKDQKDPYETIDKVKKGVEEYYREKLIEAIKKEHPNDYNSYRILRGVLNDEESEKFRSPDVRYASDGLFKASLSFASDIDVDGSERRVVTFITKVNSNDNKNNDDRMGVEVEDNKKLEEYKNGVWISMGHSGSAPEIITSILKQFGDEHPSYLIRNDCADSFNPDSKNVVKIGSHSEKLSPVEISEEEYAPIRKEEIKELKEYVLSRHTKDAEEPKAKSRRMKP